MYRFVERLVESLALKKRQEKRVRESAEEMKGKQRELKNSINTTWPKQVGTGGLTMGGNGREGGK